MINILKKTAATGSRNVLVFILIFGWVFSGYSNVSINVGTHSFQFPPKIQTALAAITASSTIYGPGTHTYIVSSNACTQNVSAWGAGGGGSVFGNGGTGGGGGAFASSTLTEAISSSHTLVIIAGGAEDTALGVTTGQSTYDTDVVIADNGVGVGNGNSTSGGLVSNSVGDVVFAGGNGGDGHTTGDEGAGGGGAAGPDGAGVAAGAASANTPSPGGAGNAGTGGSAGTAGASQDGGAGGDNTTLGGGGGGGGQTNGSGGHGGNPGAGGGSSENGGTTDQGGGDGQITITEYINDAGCGGADPPTVTTSAASGETVFSATLNGDITVTGGSNSTVRGFAYGTASDLSTTIATTSEDGDFGVSSFTEFISAFQAGITYYFRAYATSPNGTGYGSILNFTTGTDTTPSRKMRLFEGFTIKLIGNTIILYGQ